MLLFTIINVSIHFYSAYSYSEFDFKFKVDQDYKIVKGDIVGAISSYCLYGEPERLFLSQIGWNNIKITAITYFMLISFYIVILWLEIYYSILKSPTEKNA